MADTRKLILTRDRKFNEGTADWIILIDGKQVGCLSRDETKEFVINQQAHEVCLIRKAWVKNKGLVDQVIEVAKLPGNFLDWHIHVSCTTNFITGQTEVEITEDYGQAQHNKKVWEEYLIEKENKKQIDVVINEICQTPAGARDFSKLNKLSDENRNSKYYKDSIKGIQHTYYKYMLAHYFNGEISISTILFTLKELACIYEINEDINFLIKHYDYIVEKNNHINSVLTDNFIEELKEIQTASLDFPDELLSTYERAKKLADKKNMQGALKAILCADFPVTCYEDLKRFLLKCALLEGGMDEFSQAYKTMIKVIDDVFKPMVVQEEEMISVKTVDAIIAEAIRYSNVNSINKVNGVLEQFLTLTCPFYNIGESQYTLLQKVFNYLEAYEQEKMVLEAMVTNCISRTQEQEQRLEFLKNNKISNDTKFKYQIQEQDVPEDKFIYDYRFMGYSDTDLKAVFNDLSLKNVTLDRPLVVREWNKSINVDSFKYDIDKLHEHLKATMSENFPNRYKVGIVSATVASTGELAYEREYTDAILIMDDLTYNWLAFYIEGAQLLKNKITFSIYAIYWPQFDLYVDIEEDIYKRNEKICSKIEILKKQMNPKFNTYMNTIIEVIIDDLEKWMNDTGNSSIYD